MRLNFGYRETGSTLIIIMVFVVLLFALSAGLTMTSVVNSRASGESEVRMRAFYLADSGAQVGIAKVRASNGDLNPTSFTETIAGESASVSITKQGDNLYSIMSSGTFKNEQCTVETYVRFTGNFSLPGAVTMMFGNGMEMEASRIPINLGDSSMLSGKDHTETGTLKSDQSKGIEGLAMNSVPGKGNFSVAGSGTLEGVPEPSANNAAYMGSSLKALRDHAKNSGDIRIFGSKKLGTADTGAYGTASDPKLVYVSVGEEGSVDMSGNFSGYGTLVINASETEDVSLFRMSQSASWNGLVLIYVSEEAKKSGGALVRLSEQAKILGGLAVMFNGEKVEIECSGKLLQESGTASILYSSDLISSASGASVGSQRTAEVISYRIQ